MSTLRRRVPIECPVSLAPRLLAAFFKVHEGADHEVARFEVGLEANIPGLPAPLSVSHAVVATLTAQPHPTDMQPRFLVAWSPTGGAPLPSFDGTLTVESDEDYNSFFLVLDGTYEPPMGLPGRAFDALLGHRIAEATADLLLHRIRAFVEKAHAEDEAGKRVDGNVTH
jgi:hypothetical protein